MRKCKKIKKPTGFCKRCRCKKCLCKKNIHCAQITSSVLKNKRSRRRSNTRRSRRRSNTRRSRSRRRSNTRRRSKKR